MVGKWFFVIIQNTTPFFDVGMNTGMIYFGFEVFEDGLRGCPDEKAERGQSPPTSPGVYEPYGQSAPSVINEMIHICMIRNCFILVKHFYSRFQDNRMKNPRGLSSPRNRGSHYLNHLYQ